ncbi:hypothetical protein [Asticcacaulis excentricus]|uniref:Uncharacterized protein n=1 Tax=Asticcacaulis excentricus TaxID=78587 RepID=A0A3G9FZX1_9CAUL|nr:hypothetical protein [Asticcacaulis excentricus]BBF79906.1 hypothetical protein EM6_0483 [Asticcacaulis excentricus]
MTSTGEQFQLVSPPAEPMRPKRRARRPATPAARPYFNEEDFRMVLDIVCRYAPALLSRKMKRYFSRPFELHEAILIYALRTELQWPREQLRRPLGRGIKHITAMTMLIEDLRDDHDFIETICTKVAGYANGLHL